MKELSIEEKAKAYDKALANAKYYHSEIEGHVCCVLEDCFPDLKEDEDEKIREQILDYFVAKKVNESQPVLDSWIAWLEKQGEPIDKEKVMIGARKDIALSIINYLDNNSVGMCLSNMECKDIEDACVNSKWTKLYNYMKKKLEKQGEQKEFALKSAMEAIKEEKVDNANKVELKDYNSIDPHFCKLVDKVESKFKVGDWIISHYNHVAYVKSIDEKNYSLSCNDGNSEKLSIDCINRNWRLWTVEDAKDGDVLCSGQLIILFKQWEVNADCNFAIAHAGVDISGKLQITNRHWLISNKSKPATKEQRDILFKAMADAGYTFDFEKKELKEISSPVLSSSSHIGKNVPAEWSEDDERERKRVVGLLEGWLSTFKETCYAEDCKCGIDWLKSLKDRYTWKPSEEQINALDSTLQYSQVSHNSYEHLNSLYNDLKKLRGE